MKEIFKNIGKGLLVVAGAAAVVAGGMWVAEQISADEGDLLSADESMNDDGEVTES